MITIATEVKYIEYKFEDLKAIEINLQDILIEELKYGLSNDLVNSI